MASVVSVDEFARLSQELLALKTQLYETKEREQSAVHKQQAAELEAASLRNTAAQAAKAKSGLKGIFGNNKQQEVVEDLRPQIEELKLQNESLKASCSHMMKENQQLQEQVTQFKEQLGVERTATEKSAEEEKNALTAARLADLEDQVGAFKIQEGEKEQEISNMMQQCLKKDERIGKLTADIESLEAKLKEKDLAVKEQDSRIKKLASDAAKPAKVSAIQDQMKKVTEGLTEANEKLETEKKELEARLVAAEQSLIQQQALVVAAQNAGEGEKRNAHVLTMEKDKLQASHQQLLETHEKAKEKYEQDIKQLKERFQTAQASCTTLEASLKEDLSASQRELDFVKESLAATQTLLVEANEKAKQGAIDTAELKKVQEELRTKLSATETAFEESKVNNTIEGKKRNRLVEELRSQLKKEAIRVRELEASVAETKDALAERRHSGGESSVLKDALDEASRKSSGGSEIEQEVSAALSIRLEQSQTENYALKQKSRYLEQNIQLLNEDVIAKKAVIQFLSRRIEPGAGGTPTTNPEAHKLFQSQPPAVQQELFDKMEIALQEAVSLNLEIKDNLRKMGSEGTRLLSVIDTLDADKRQLEDELTAVREMYQELKDEKELNEMARQDAEKLLKHTEAEFKAEISMLSNSVAQANLNLKLVQMERDRLLAQAPQVPQQTLEPEAIETSAKRVEPTETTELAKPVVTQADSATDIPLTPEPSTPSTTAQSSATNLAEDSLATQVPQPEQKNEPESVEVETPETTPTDPRLTDILNADLTLPSNKPPPAPEVAQEPEPSQEDEEVEIISSVGVEKPPAIVPLALSTRRNSEPIEKENKEESETQEPVEDVPTGQEPVECVAATESEPESPMAVDTLTEDAEVPTLSSPLAEVSLSGMTETKLPEEEASITATTVTPQSEQLQAKSTEEPDTPQTQTVVEDGEAATKSESGQIEATEQPVAAQNEEVPTTSLPASVTPEESVEQVQPSTPKASEQMHAPEEAAAPQQVESPITVSNESEQEAQPTVATEADSQTEQVRDATEQSTPESEVKSAPEQVTSVVTEEAKTIPSDETALPAVLIPAETQPQLGDDLPLTANISARTEDTAESELVAIQDDNQLLTTAAQLDELPPNGEETLSASKEEADGLQDNHIPPEVATVIHVPKENNE